MEEVVNAISIHSYKFVGGIGVFGGDRGRKRLISFGRRRR
jgi:hypothetical protein